MRILGIKCLNKEEIAEIHEWLRDNHIDLSPQLRLDQILKPNFPECFPRHRFSKKEKLAMKITCWENFNSFMEKNYHMSLDRVFIEMLARGMDKAAETLLHEFIQLQKRQRLLMESEGAVEQAHVSDELQSRMIGEFTEDKKEECQEVAVNKPYEQDPSVTAIEEELSNYLAEEASEERPSIVISYKQFEKMYRESREKDAIIAVYEQRLANVEAMVKRHTEAGAKSL